MTCMEPEDTTLVYYVLYSAKDVPLGSTSFPSGSMSLCRVVTTFLGLEMFL